MFSSIENRDIISLSRFANLQSKVVAIKIGAKFGEELYNVMHDDYVNSIVIEEIEGNRLAVFGDGKMPMLFVNVNHIAAAEDMQAVFDDVAEAVESLMYGASMQYLMTKE